MDAFKEEIGRTLEPLTGIGAARIADLLEVPPEPVMGDLAFPCYILASSWKQAPAAIAQRLGEQLSGQRGTYWEKASAKGSYLNFFLDPVAMAREVLQQVYSQGDCYGGSRLGEGKTVVIDFSAPNIAKPFGIGHLRSTVIGHALYLIFQALGYRCVGINHLGDWGTQFGKLIVAFRRWGEEEQLQSDPIGYLYRLYVRFHQEAETDGALEEEARAWFSRLEQGDREAEKIWRRFKELSLGDYQRIYQRLGVEFDYVQGESFYNDRIEDVLRLVQERNLAVESDGALIIDLEKHGLPPCLLRKKDGATLYITRDLAAAIYRYEQFKFDRMLYVVGSEQTLHFQQMFKVLELLGFEWAKNCVHVPFGLIRFKDGRMSTRAGKMVLLEEVLERAESLALKIIEEKNPSLPDKPAVAAAVAVGAIRFGDLSNDRIKDIEFDWDKVLDFSGETAAYIQYAHTRICSILRKAGETPEAPEEECLHRLNSEEEKTLLKVLAAMPEKVRASAESYRPSILARYLVDVAREFNRFYHNCPVLGSDPLLQKARLLLVGATRQVIANGLGLLGIAAPREM